MTARGRFEVVNKLGLHARAASRLVEVSSRYACDISVGRDGQMANAKSVMGVLLLCGAQGTVLDVEASGEAEQEAVDEIGRLIADRFGEGE
jgi:phosphocarrier protein